MLDLTVIATPFYFGSMGAEHLYLKRRAAANGAPARTDYEWHDTLASLSMGVGSLLAPMVMPKLLGPVLPKGRFRTVLLVGAAGAAVATTVADVLSQRTADGSLPPAGALPDPTASVGEGEAAADRDADRANRSTRRRLGRLARRVASAGGVTAVAAGTTAVATSWAARTTAKRLFARRVVPDLGTGVVAIGLAMVGWDLIYYWNHRLQHESRFLWAIHVVHHSSERYNLSTALRQPVADSFGVFVPVGLLSLLGIRPDLVMTARGVNLLYQFWIHTDAIRTLGPVEEVFNSPSLHRVHHGANSQYIDRNHGGILIVWDRLFGTYELEDEPVVYGLTKNIDTYNPARIISHEYGDILRDVAASTSWSERLSFVFRGPGWAYRRHAEALADPAVPDEAVPLATAGVA